MIFSCFYFFTFLHKQVIGSPGISLNISRPRKDCLRSPALTENQTLNGTLNLYSHNIRLLRESKPVKITITRSEILDPANQLYSALAIKAVPRAPNRASNDPQTDISEPVFELEVQSQDPIDPSWLIFAFKFVVTLIYFCAGIKQMIYFSHSSINYCYKTSASSIIMIYFSTIMLSYQSSGLLMTLYSSFLVLPLQLIAILVSLTTLRKRRIQVVVLMASIAAVTIVGGLFDVVHYQLLPYIYLSPYVFWAVDKMLNKVQHKPSFILSYEIPRTLIIFADFYLPYQLNGVDESYLMEADCLCAGLFLVIGLVLLPLWIILLDWRPKLKGVVKFKHNLKAVFLMKRLVRGKRRPCFKVVDPLRSRSGSREAGEALNGVAADFGAFGGNRGEDGTRITVSGVNLDKIYDQQSYRIPHIVFNHVLYRGYKVGIKTKNTNRDSFGRVFTLESELTRGIVFSTVRTHSLSHKTKLISINYNSKCKPKKHQRSINTHN